MYEVACRSDPRRTRQRSRNQEWESIGHDRCFLHETAAPEARREVSPARQGWEKISETKPERRRRDSSRGLGKGKRNKAPRNKAFPLWYSSAANGVSPLRGSKTSNGAAHFPNPYGLG